MTKCYIKLEICLGKGGNIVEKRRKSWLPEFSPFPTMFSNVLNFLRVVKSQDFLVKS